VLIESKEENAWRNELTKMQQNGDESGAATRRVKNKLCAIIGGKGKSLASLGHDQSVFRPRCGKCHYTMRHVAPSPGPSASVG
jgi:ribosomal protein S27AE